VSASQVPAALWRDPHFRRAVEWARLAGPAEAGDSPLWPRVVAELDAVSADARGEDYAFFKMAVFELGGANPLAMRLARAEETAGRLAAPVGAEARRWRLAYPRPFSELVARWATERGLEPGWLWSIMRVESNFDPTAVSWANAYGLMQIILPTAKNLARDTAITATADVLLQPAIAIELGTKYLARLLDRHKVYPLASAGYNAGGGAVAKWRKSFGDLPLDEFVEKIPYREANLYAKAATQTLARYKWLYEGTILTVPLDPPGAPGDPKGE
jgi:soluble lytic murein transglycosylase-like protein